MNTCRSERPLKLDILASAKWRLCLCKREAVKLQMSIGTGPLIVQPICSPCLGFLNSYSPLIQR